MGDICETLGVHPTILPGSRLIVWWKLKKNGMMDPPPPREMVLRVRHVLECNEENLDLRGGLVELVRGEDCSVYTKSLKNVLHRLGMGRLMSI